MRKLIFGAICLTAWFVSSTVNAQRDETRTPRYLGSGKCENPYTGATFACKPCQKVQCDSSGCYPTVNC